MKERCKGFCVRTVGGDTCSVCGNPWPADHPTGDPSWKPQPGHYEPVGGHVRYEQSEDGRATSFKSCPCHYTTPCTPSCTCVTRGSSTGCRRCCSYGSVEQRKARAEILARLIDKD